MDKKIANTIPLEVKANKREPTWTYINVVEGVIAS